MPKIGKIQKFTAEKIYFIFFDQKFSLLIPGPLVSIKDVQATGEAFSPQKRTSSTSKHDTYFLTYFYLCGSFLPDPDPKHCILEHFCICTTKKPFGSQRKSKKPLNMIEIYFALSLRVRHSWAKTYFITADKKTTHKMNE